MINDSWLEAERAIIAIRYGTRPCLKSDVFFGYDRYDLPDADLYLDYYFWLIKAGGEFTLVDTGFDADVGVRRGRTVLCPPMEALQKTGVGPERVSRIVLSHMHYDHTGNLKTFPNAEIVAQARELEFWTGPYAGRPHFAHEIERSDIDLLVAARDTGRLRLVDGDAAVAPGVQVKLVGGHTVGQQIVLVESPGNRVILAADAVHYYEEIEEDRPYIVFSDLVQMYQAYDVIRQLLSEDSTALVAGHDPKVTQRFAAAGGDKDGLLFRIA